MPNEFIVRVSVAAQPDDGHPKTREYRFSRLPISIGRAPENDLSISNRFVSTAHARIEEIGGQLCVHDLGSRNGVQVWVGGERVRIPARTPYEVARVGFEFWIGSEVSIRIERGRPSTAGASPPESLGPLGLSGIGDGLPALPQGGRPPRELPPLELPPGGSLGDAPGGFSLPNLARRNPSWEAPEPAPRRSTDPARGFEPVKAPLGPKPERNAGELPLLRTGSFDLSLEVLALQGLREIVASLTPGRSLDSRGDVARLISRLHNTFEVLCGAFLSLRDGYTKFMVNLHLQRSAQYDPARVALDTARDPTAVAGHLLDFRENAPDSSQALEAALKELSLHQVALLDGLMEGIRALLEELSPDAIKNEVEHTRSAPRRGRGEAALWQEYCERYARFSEEGEAFARVFGKEFTSAYRNYRRGRSRGAR